MSATITNTDFPADQVTRDAHDPFVGGDQATGQGHGPHVTHTDAALPGSDHPDGQRADATHRKRAVGDQLPAGAAIISSVPKDVAHPLLDPLLTLASITMDDLEELRKAQENRYRSLTQSGTSENGLEWGFGLDDRDPNVAAAGAIVDQIKQMEHQAVLNLQRLMRKHPLGPWVKGQKGVGEKQAARLLGVIGDPYWHSAENRPRTVSELWAYCGLKPGQKRQRGTQANWSTEAKTRAYLIAEACLKAQGPYAEVYYQRKAHTEDREHSIECVRCGPAGKPAQPGTAWSKAHRHADALRVVSKEVLKDLWRASRALHQGAEV